MSAHDPLDLPCPTCGYDLRATPFQNGRRCPECGTLSRSSVRSRIPWTHRRSRGSLRSYLATTWLLLRRPSQFTTEPWLNPRDAQKFHRLSLLLATLLATALLMATFYARGDQWRHDLAARLPTYADRDAPTDLAFPINALTDSFWIILPMSLSLCLGSALTLWTYRLFLRAASGNYRHRRRVQRIGLYASALLPITHAFLGLLALGGIVLYEDHPWLTGLAETAWTAALLILALPTVFFFYAPTLTLVWKTGRWRILRTLFFFPLFPYVAILLFFCTAIAVFWSTGYTLIALWSMFH